MGRHVREDGEVVNPRVYTVSVAAELVQPYTEWQRVRDIPADWVKVVPHGDGTAEVWFSKGDEPPRDQ